MKIGIIPKTILLCSMVIGLAGCGVKPKDVEPPAGKENSSFPRTYPSPEAED